MSPLSRRLVLRLFLVVGVALPVQYALAGFVGLHHREPWPAVILPGFATVRGAGGPVEVVRPSFEVHFAGGGSLALPVDRLLEGVPRSHHPGMLDAGCRPATLSGTQGTERCLDPEVRHWLRARVERAFPDRRAERLDVVWTRVRVEVQGGAFEEEHLGTLALPMEDAR